MSSLPAELPERPETFGTDTIDEANVEHCNGWWATRTSGDASSPSLPTSLRGYDSWETCNWIHKFHYNHTSDAQWAHLSVTGTNALALFFHLAPPYCLMNYKAAKSAKTAETVIRVLLWDEHFPGQEIHSTILVCDQQIESNHCEDYEISIVGANINKPSW